ncbi:MAG: tRNA (guanosine(46)-N7)-methyltransferase TrmB [Pirellulales bacterium]
MGRRALPKLDPTLDLARHLKSIDQLPRPWDAAALFGTDAPLEVEVGSGKGLFLQSAATGLAGHNFLGIEVAQKYAQHSAARLAKRSLTNAIIVQGDAQRVFREFLPDGALAAVHVYFPDPWWKKRHRKRRVMNEAFLKDVVRTLTPGGRFHFWTDVEEYFQAGLALLAEHTPLVGPLEVAERPAEHDLDFQTHFERRMRMSAMPVFRSEFCKES